MIKTLLFDLDGTLLHVDMERFLPKYMAALTKMFEEHIPPRLFMDRLLEATRAMMENRDPGKTNKEVFTQYFFANPGFEVRDLMPLFERFYRDFYGSLRKYTRLKPEAYQVIRRAKELDFQVVIATNPLFPATAIRQRLEWAGIGSFRYSLVTSYEIMHFCKPNLHYYQEILDMMDKKAEECIMIGNDVDDDMVASRLGIRTYLVDDLLVNGNNTPVRANWQGSLKDFCEELEMLKEREELT